jgi:hypothetical protein
VTVISARCIALVHPPSPPSINPTARRDLCSSLVSHCVAGRACSEVAGVIAVFVLHLAGFKNMPRSTANELLARCLGKRSNTVSGD